MLGYQFLAMASEAEVEEEPSEQYHFPQQATVKRASVPVPLKPGANTWPVQLLHRIYPKATLMQVTPDLTGVPEGRRMWFAVAGKVPARGTTVLVTLQADGRNTTFPGVYMELTSPKKLKTNVGENKAMQPVHLSIVN